MTLSSPVVETAGGSGFSALVSRNTVILERNVRTITTAFHSQPKVYEGEHARTEKDALLANLRIQNDSALLNTRASVCGKFTKFDP